MSNRERYRFPSILFQFLDSYFESYVGVESLESTLAALDVTESQLHDPQFLFNGEHVFKMLDLLIKYSEEEPPALRVLKHVSINNTGMAGVAGITAMTLSDALAVALKFYKFLMPVVDVQRVDQGELFRLDMCLVEDFEHCGPTLLEIVAGALKKFADEATGRTLDVTMCFSHAPSWQPGPQQLPVRFEAFFGCRVVFNAERTSLILPADIMNLRLKNRNKIMHTYAQSIADEEMSKLSNPDAFADKVTALLSNAMRNDEVLSMDELAHHLHMTTRTLARKLAKEGKHYKSLLNDVRFERAKTLLSTADMPVKQLAQKLGFSNADAFSRAFKAYVGVTPGQWKSGSHE